jgi:serine protease Do
MSKIALICGAGDKSSHSIWTRLTLIVLLGFVAESALAQPPDNGYGRRGSRRWFRTSVYSKNNAEIRSLLAPTVAPAAAATVRVLSDGHEVAWGTVVAAEGLIVTKGSQLAAKIECRMPDGKKLPATLIGTDEATDLALLRVDAKNLTPVTWAAKPAEPGSIVAVTGRGDGPMLIGVVSDVPQAMPGPSRGGRYQQHGWLGITLGQVGENPEVQRVTKESAAEKAGLKNGDQIKRLDGAAVHSTDEFIETLSKLPPNKKVSLVVSRNDRELSLEAILGKSPPPGELPQDNWGGGPFSDRRYGFPAVIPHDLPLAPTDCGGPLVDIDGRCLGVNIARALRVASYALPASVVQETVAKIRAQAKTP